MSNHSFNDFVGSISLDTIYQISDDAAAKMQEIAAHMDAQSPAVLGTQVAAVAYTISIELLGLYHKWREDKHLD